MLFSHYWFLEFPIKVPVIGIESMVTRAGLCYTRDCLTPGKFSTIKPAAVEKLMPFPVKIHTVILSCTSNPLSTCNQQEPWSMFCVIPSAMVDYQYYNKCLHLWQGDKKSCENKRCIALLERAMEECHSRRYWVTFDLECDCLPMDPILI